MEGAGFAQEKISERHDKWEVVINDTDSLYLFGRVSRPPLWHLHGTLAQLNNMLSSRFGPKS